MGTPDMAEKPTGTREECLREEEAEADAGAEAATAAAAAETKVDDDNNDDDDDDDGDDDDDDDDEDDDEEDDDDDDTPPTPPIAGSPERNAPGVERASSFRTVPSSLRLTCLCRDRPSSDGVSKRDPPRF